MSKTTDEAWEEARNPRAVVDHQVRLRRAVEASARDVARETLEDVWKAIERHERRLDHLYTMRDEDLQAEQERESGEGVTHTPAGTKLHHDWTYHPPAPSEGSKGEVEPEMVTAIRHEASLLRTIAAGGGGRIDPKSADLTARQLEAVADAYARVVKERAHFQRGFDALARRCWKRVGQLAEARTEIARLQREKGRAETDSRRMQQLWTEALDALRERDAEIARLKRSRDRWERAYKDDIPHTQREIARLREERDRLQAERAGEVWLWQGDGSDEPDSLSCPVLMHPDDLRKLLAKIAHLSDPENWTVVVGEDEIPVTQLPWQDFKIRYIGPPETQEDDDGTG